MTSRLEGPSAPVACLDPDAALTIVGALGPDAEDVLAHLSSCPACRLRLGELVRLRGALAEEPVREGFADDVVAALPPAHRPGVWLWHGVNAALIAGTLVMILITLDAVTSPIGALTGAVVGTAVTGVGVALWGRRTRAA